MKFIQSLILLAGSLVFSSALAQQVNYTIEHDDPVKDPVAIINLDLLSLDMATRNLDGMAFTYGIWGIIEPVPRIGATFDYDRSWFALGRLGFKNYPTSQELNLGGYFVLAKGSKTKPTKVTLKVEDGGTTYSTNTAGDRVQTRTEIETYIMVHAQRYRQFGVRGGLFYKTGGYNVQDAMGLDGLEYEWEHTQLTSTGLYGGIFLRSASNLFVNTDNYGRQMNSAMSDLYLDVMLVPGNKIVNLDVEEGQETEDITDQLKEIKTYSPIGFRLGWSIYQFEKRDLTGKKFGLSSTFEAGLNPYQGWFVKGGIGITLIKVTR